MGNREIDSRGLADNDFWRLSERERPEIEVPAWTQNQFSQCFLNLLHL